MSERPTNYPLAWPLGYPRTKSRQNAQFKSRGTRLSVTEGVHRLEDQIEAFNRKFTTRATNLIISTNIQPTLSGRPRSNQGEPNDPGVAVYFTLDGKPKVLCCDKWLRVADNLAAIAHTITALRGIDRWGVAEDSRAFAGFDALPAPGEAKGLTCWEILGIQYRAGITAQEIDAAWRDRAKTAHPDTPTGSHTAMCALNNAREQALQYIRA